MQTNCSISAVVWSSLALNRVIELLSITLVYSLPNSIYWLLNIRHDSMQSLEGCLQDLKFTNIILSTHCNRQVYIHILNTAITGTVNNCTKQLN